MKKLIALVIVAVMLLGMMPMMAMAADGTTVYMNPDGWRVDDAKFAIWCFESNNGGSDKFVSMTARSDGLFEAVVPAGYQKIIFVRMNGSTAGNSWDHKWDQTADLDLPTNGDNCYKISSAAWSKFVTDPITVHVNVSSAWGEVVPVVWAWGTAGDVFSNPGWPGKTMEVDAFNDGWYTMELPYTTTGLLLNDRGTTTLLKTENYTISAGEELWLTVGEYKNDNNNGAEKIYAAVSSAAAPTGWYTSAPIKVTLDPGEGAVEPTMLTADPDGNVTLPAASRPNYVFDGWYKEAELTNLVGQAGKTVTFTGNATIYAKWSEDMTGRHTITFMNGTNEFTTAITKKVDANIGKLETIPDGPTAPANYTFGGWYKDLNDENSKVTTNTEFTAPTNAYAKWVKKPTLTLSFNLNGGEGNAPADVSSVDGVVALPAAPSRDGYTFNGWYDAATGGNLVIAADATTYTFTGEADASKTLYAQWTGIVKITVYAKVPSSWTKCQIWAWGNGGDAFDTWSGPEMTLGSDGWYSIQVPNWVTGIILNDGGDACKTGDITVDENKDVWITVAEDKTTSVAYEKPAADDDDDEQGGGSVTPPPTTEMITVHAKVPTDWEAAYLYAWTTSPYKAWPGAAMAQGTEGWWTVEIPEGMANIIVSDGNGTQTVDLQNEDADIVWVVLGEKNPDGKYEADVTATKPSDFSDENAGNYVPPAAPTDFYLVGYINGADYYETTHKFVNGKLTITLTADSYAMIKDNNGDVYGTAAYCTEKTANMAIGGGEKMFVPKGEITFTLTVNADGTVKLSYTVPTPEGGNEGGNQGGTEGGNQSGTTGNPEVPTGSLIIHAKVPAAWASAYLYAWNTGDDVMASWPGTAMTKGDDGWYTIEIPAGYKNIIVAEKNGGEQTVDLSIANVTGNEIWVTLGEKNSDGKYPATIAEDEKGEEIVAPPEVKQITVYAKVPANWTTPYVYAWNGSGNNASWPGVAMTKGENGWWYAKVPATAENVIISNNGKTQTVDLKLEKLSVDAFVQVAAAGADGKYTATVQYSTNPDTGDTAIIAPVVFLMVMSVTGLAVLTVGKKKYF